MNTPSAAPNSDYFTNHDVVGKWPFSLYHGPIAHSLKDTLDAYASQARPLRILVFGCGLFHEMPLFPANAILTLVDADARLDQALRAKHGDKAPFTFLCALTPQELRTKLRDQRFDLIVAKEVIEHITDVSPYLQSFRQALTPTGRLWLSTPNYGYWTLPLVEYTFLEIIARLKGFSRLHIHPNKYGSESLAEELRAAGFAEVNVSTTPFKLALTATAAVA